jgi:hypothetical protein
VALPGSSSKVSGTIKVAAGVVAATTALATAATSATAAPALHTNASGHVHIYRTSLTPAQIKAYSKSPTQRVVVLLRNQFSNTLAGGNSALATRADALRASQSSLVHELTALKAPNVKQYSFINAVAASVSTAEVARLKADPAVKAVVPDSKISMNPDGFSQDRAKTAAPAAHNAAAPLPPNPTPGICGTHANPLLQPEGLRRIGAATAHRGTTGKGVKVAVFPDGLDPNIKDFIRPNGSHAIFDYRDFTGDGPNGVTGAGEAFGDASSIISQGRQVFDLSGEVNTNLPLPKGCDIKIKGVAPGASLAVMKVFGGTSSFSSDILQGMDWAVSHDHVNILSQSFGGNPIPSPGTDPISVFDTEAVAHGITVVASTGDAGVTNTIGSPSNAKGVIAAAATTDFQANAQLSEHGYQLGGYKGWESNNISSFSSSGFTDVGPGTVDVLAPGDTGWADCSRNIDIYIDCGNSFGGAKNVPIEQFGGTSQSCPFTAGVAALVIQSYKLGHHGNGPSPAVVKTIITNTATNLGFPAQDQGAGQVNALRAVDLARSFHSSKRVGNTLAINRRKIVREASPSTRHIASIKVTNEGTTSRTVSPRVRQFGAPTTLTNATVAYNPANPATKTFIYWIDGLPEQYAEQFFTVPSGFQRLNSRIGYPADPTDGAQTVSEVLFDPKGKIAADSEPQGAPLGFSQVEVRNPMPGKWHAIYFSRPGSDKFSGNIATLVTVQKLLSVAGAVSPTSARLQPGASKTFAVRFRMPRTAGDSSSEVSFGSKVGGVPILMRTKVTPTVAKPGTFTGELTDGNGRMFFAGQELPFVFDIPAGVKDVDADVHIADPGYTVEGVLVNPNNAPVDAQDTDFVDLTNPNAPDTNGQNLHLSWSNPRPGLWGLDLVTVGGSSSGKTSSTVSGSVAFNTVNVTSSNVPDSASTMLDPGATHTAHITVHNTGTSPEIYYVDPRLAGNSTYSLGFIDNPNGVLPLGAGPDAVVPQALVPPSSNSLSMVANASRPVNFTTSPGTGTPEIASTDGKTAVASVSRSDLPASAWSCPPTLIGPFGHATSTATFSCAGFATTRTFDDTIAATGGNLWDAATDPNSTTGFDPGSAHVVQPGASTTLTVAITPTQEMEGETVSGFLAVQTLDVNTFASDDLVHIPYSYTVTIPPPA